MCQVYTGVGRVRTSAVTVQVTTCIRISTTTLASVVPGLKPGTSVRIEYGIVHVDLNGYGVAI